MCQGSEKTPLISSSEPVNCVKIGRHHWLWVTLDRQTVGSHMCSDQGMWKDDDMEVYVQIAFPGSELAVMGRTKAVVRFLNLAPEWRWAWVDKRA